MPLVRKLCNGLWEIRTELKGVISRVLFTLSDNRIILLHGFIKKTNKTPKDDLDLAIKKNETIKKG